MLLLFSPALVGCGVLGDLFAVPEATPGSSEPRVCEVAVRPAEAGAREPTCAPLETAVDWSQAVKWEVGAAELTAADCPPLFQLASAIGDRDFWHVLLRAEDWVDVSATGIRCGSVDPYDLGFGLQLSPSLYRSAEGDLRAYIAASEPAEGHTGCFAMSSVDLDTMLWRPVAYDGCSWFTGPPTSQLGVADLNHDGTPEAYTCGRAWLPDGSAGPPLRCEAQEGLSTSLATDIDQDGALEILDDMGRWPVDGSPGVEWTHATGRMTFPAVLTDAAGTLAVLSGGEGRVCRFDPYTGETRWCDHHTGVGSGAGYPVAIAAGDTDGDGVPEVCAAMGGTLRLFDLDGNVLWTAPRSPDGRDSMGQCAMADLDADGLMEVVDWSDLGVQIFRGADGTLLSVYAPEARPRSDETVGPMILDLDGDGSAEILVDGWVTDTSQVIGVSGVLLALGPASGSWAPTRPVWNQFAYDITSVDDEGHILAWPQPAWETVNAFRAQPARAGNLADLRPVFVDSCSDSCADDSTLRLSVTVENTGSAEAAPGAVVALLSNVSGGMREVARVVVPDEIPAGTSSASVAIEVPRSELGTTQYLEVYAPDRAGECNPLDNRVPVVVDSCP